jgi:hypothetical protein
MSIIPSNTQFIGDTTGVAIVEKRSSQVNSLSSPFTMADLQESALTSQPIVVTEATHPITSYNTIIDASSVAIVATLPDATTVAGTPYTIIAYNADNLITINTTSSQQIRRVSTDTFTSDTLVAGDILTLISTGTYWQVT